MIIAHVILWDGSEVSGEQANASPEGVFIDGQFYSWGEFKAYKHSLSSEAELLRWEQVKNENN